MSMNSESARSHLTGTSRLRSAGSLCSNPANNLRFLRLGDIKQSEQFSLGRQKDLVDQIRDDDILSNPLIVSHTNKGVPFIVDGHHRFESLRQLGCDYLLAQVVDIHDEKAVRFEMWSNAAFCEDPDVAFNEILTAGVKATRRPFSACLRILRTSKSVCSWTTYEEPDVGYMLDGTTLGPGQTLSLIINNVDHVKRIAPAEMAICTESATPLFREHRNRNILLQFAPINGPQIAKLVERGFRIPAGVTRSVVSPRILGANVPLNLLRSRTPDRERTAWLQDIRNRMPVHHPAPYITQESNGRRRYDESVVLY